MRKVCSSCKKVKPLSHYSKNGLTRTGLINRYPKCKDCQSADRVTKLDRSELKNIDAQARLLDRLELKPEERFKYAQAVKLLEYCVKLEKELQTCCKKNTHS